MKHKLRIRGQCAAVFRRRKRLRASKGSPEVVTKEKKGAYQIRVVEAGECDVVSSTSIVCKGRVRSSFRYSPQSSELLFIGLIDIGRSKHTVKGLFVLFFENITSHPKTLVLGLVIDIRSTVGLPPAAATCHDIRQYNYLATAHSRGITNRHRQAATVGW